MLFKNNLYKKTGYLPNVLKNMKSMKVAICVSGQLRTWDKCYQNWMKLSKKITHDPDSQVDFFCHFWDFESEGRPILDITFDDKPVKHDDKILEKAIEIYDPKKYIIEDYEKNQKVNENIRITAKEKYPEQGDPIITWSANQFYAVMRATELKRQYEMEQGFEYDVCIRVRYDEYLPEDGINKLIENLYLTSPNTIYTIQNRDITNYPFYSFGDVFWFSDSITFDKIANFYRVLPSINRELFKDSLNHLLPEYVFTHYVNDIGIINYTLLNEIKVCKRKSHINKRKELGFDNIRNNEILYETILLTKEGSQYVVNKLL